MTDQIVTALPPVAPAVPQKVSARDFFAMLGIDSRDVVKFSGDGDMIYITTQMRDAEGNLLMRGPSFAAVPVIVSRIIALVRPGRPEGTTVANGAKPKTRRVESN